MIIIKRRVCAEESEWWRRDAGCGSDFFPFSLSLSLSFSLVFPLVWCGPHMAAQFNETRWRPRWFDPRNKWPRVETNALRGGRFSFFLAFFLSLSFFRSRKREREREREERLFWRERWSPLRATRRHPRWRSRPKTKKKKPKQKGKKRSKKNETVAPQTATMTIGWLLPSFFF